MAEPSSQFRVRLATFEDVPAIRALIEESVRKLQAEYYSPEQIEGSLLGAQGVDTQLIADQTYYAVETRRGDGVVMVGCGGWSKRRTLFGSDQRAGREDSLLDPARDAAKIRAFFVHPEWVRKGIATRILEICEEAARAAGFRRLEMGATLSGVPLYRARGYAELERIEATLANGSVLPIVRMGKTLE
jgi:GNAT superfamily N-acetyltransferase